LENETDEAVSICQWPIGPRSSVAMSELGAVMVHDRWSCQLHGSSRTYQHSLAVKAWWTPTGIRPRSPRSSTTSECSGHASDHYLQPGNRWSWYLPS